MPTVSREQIIEIELEMADLLEQLAENEKIITAQSAEILRLREREKRD